MIDVTIPGGAYDALTRTGWKSPRPGRWTYQRPADGSFPVSRATITRSPRHPGRIGVSVTGRRADLLATSPSLPLTLTVTLRPPLVGGDSCAEVGFPDGRCSVAGAQAKLSCSCRANVSGMCR